MVDQAPPIVRRTQHLTRLDLRPLDPLPSPARVAAAGAVGLVLSLVACVILSEVGKHALHPPAYFDKFNLPGYVVLTAIGVVGATIGWGLLVHLTSQPRWFVVRAAVVVTVVLLLPDVAILPNNPASDVAILMVEHVLIAIITTIALLTLAPAGRGDGPRPARAA